MLGDDEFLKRTPLPDKPIPWRINESAQRHKGSHEASEGQSAKVLKFLHIA